MGLVDDVRNLERMLAHREQEKNGGLPSGHPFLRDAAKRREEAKRQQENVAVFAGDLNSLIGVLMKMRDDSLQLSKECDLLLGKHSQAMRVSDDSSIRSASAFLMRLKRFANSVVAGTNEHLRRLK